MAKYHVNPTTGNTNICRARTVCPFGGKESRFEGTKQEANRWAEGKTQQEHSRSLPSHRKEEVQRSHQKEGYKLRDREEKEI